MTIATDPSLPGGTTIRDVAGAAGVSIRTVSRVLNRSPKVNAETRARIEAAIASLKFRPSARARGLATGRSYLIGLVHNDRNALVLDTLQRGAIDEAVRRGYELVVHPACGDDASVVADVQDFVRRSRVDGLVVMAPVSGVTGLADALSAAGVPAAALSAVPLAGYPAMLVSDERDAAAAVARYLVSLGHRRIAIVNGPHGVHSAMERRAGFLAALTGAGLVPVAEDYGDYGFPAGFDAAARLLERHARPTAIFAANDVMAAAVLKAAAARGLAVPGDLSVVGFDGSILARMLTPALTTVRRPLRAMAETATRRVIDLIEGVGGDAIAPPDLALAIGDSSGPPPAAAR